MIDDGVRLVELCTTPCRAGLVGVYVRFCGFVLTVRAPMESRFGLPVHAPLGFCSDWECVAVR